MTEEDIEKVKSNYVQSLWNDYNYSMQKFDEQTLLLSGGALGLSLTFLKDIVPLDKSIHIWLFYLSVSLFVLVILLGFISHRLSATAIKRTIENVEQGNYDFKIDKSVPIINNVNTGALFLGITFLVSYCIINIHNYRKKETSNPKQVIEIIKPLGDSTTLYIKAKPDSIYFKQILPKK